MGTRDYQFINLRCERTWKKPEHDESWREGEEVGKWWNYTLVKMHRKTFLQMTYIGKEAMRWFNLLSYFTCTNQIFCNLYNRTVMLSYCNTLIHTVKQKCVLYRSIMCVSGWKDSLAVNSSCCSLREPRFSSQNLRGILQASVTPFPQNTTASTHCHKNQTWTWCACLMYLQANTHT